MIKSVMRRLGVHTSISGGLHLSLERARELGCDTVQIFSHNPRGWALPIRGADEIALFKRLAERYSVAPVYIHTSYLINVASANPELLEKSLDMVTGEMNIADSIGAGFVVLHTGSASGDDPKTARKRASALLREVFKRGKWRAGLLLENTAGESGDIASRIEEISDIMQDVPAGLIAGICLDTCHAFAAGYRLTMEEGIDSLAGDIRRYLGRDAVKLIHLNDSKEGVSSGTDRHEHIGKGKIGLSGFSNLLKHPFYSDIPLILETPKKSTGDDNMNLDAVRRLLRNGLPHRK
jgi:deoxyribonuclease-4